MIATQHLADFFDSQRLVYLEHRGQPPHSTSAVV
jgi:hypothetical protein